MEHMALVLDSYQLLDDPDQSMSLVGHKMQPLYASRSIPFQLSVSYAHHCVTPPLAYA